MAFWKKKEKIPQITGDLPRHLAIIMDGNGRWAKKRGLPRTAGHAAGAETFRRIATHCKHRGIAHLTVYAFSTENWRRPVEEVEAIMGLLEKYLLEAIDSMAKDKIALHLWGDLSVLSPKLQALCEKTQAINETYQPDIDVNICLNYGGRDELVHAMQCCLSDCMAQKRSPDDLTAQDLEQYLYSAGVPDPDLVIRPSGEIRISNFLLWQSAYAEFAFTEVLWPDFGEAELDRILLEYQNRQRRFGGV